MIDKCEKKFARQKTQDTQGRKKIDGEQFEAIGNGMGGLRMVGDLASHGTWVMMNPRN